MKFDRKNFFDAYRTEFGRFQVGTMQCLEFLLDQFEGEPKIWNSVPKIAYALATIKHETADTFAPIQEFGGAAYFEKRYGYQTKVGKSLGNDAKGEGAKYSGKGFVQLTGESNYEKLETKLREKYPDAISQFEDLTGQTFDLTDYADQAKNPRLAFLIMTIGMHEGIYTGKKLSEYFNSKEKDYVEARRIINGKDKAALIAGYAERFENVLNDAFEVTTEFVGKRIDSLISPQPSQPETSFLPAVQAEPKEILQSASGLGEKVGGFVEQGNEQISGLSEKLESSVGAIKETITEKTEEAGKEIEKTTSEVKSTFDPKNIPAFIPRFGKQWFLSLIPGGGLLATIAAKLAAMPDWLVFTLGFFTGVTTVLFFQLIIKHREKVLDFITYCYQATANPEMHNLIPTSANALLGRSPFALARGLRGIEIERTFEK